MAKKDFTIILITLLILVSVYSAFSYGADTTITGFSTVNESNDSTPEPYCGDGDCNGDETCETCETDCSACPTLQNATPYCGDGTCDADETCSACIEDCGECQITNETNNTTTTSYCGDGTCDADEDCEICVEDCGECQTANTNENIINSVVDDNSFVSADSLLNGANVINSTIQSSVIYDSTIKNALVSNAYIEDNILESGSFTYGSQTYSGETDLALLYSCGNAVCNSNENCTTCADDCGACIEKTILDLYSYGQSEIIYQFSYLRSDTPLILNADKSDLAITKIKLNTDTVESSVQINIEFLDDKPSSISTPDGELYQYFEIEKTNFSNSDINSVYIDFRIEDDWIEDNDLDKTSVVLRRYVGEDWEDVDTDYEDEDSSYYYYSAEPDGFSYFSVVAEDVLPSCGDGDCNGDETVSSCPDDCAADSCGDGTCGSGETRTNCPEDCNFCGNGICDSGEDEFNCLIDCDVYTTIDYGLDQADAVCGNGICEFNEQYLCEEDCAYGNYDVGTGVSQEQTTASTATTLKNQSTTVRVSNKSLSENLAELKAFSIYDLPAYQLFLSLKTTDFKANLLNSDFYKNIMSLKTITVEALPAYGSVQEVKSLNKNSFLTLSGFTSVSSLSLQGLKSELNSNLDSISVEVSYDDIYSLDKFYDGLQNSPKSPISAAIISAIAFLFLVAGRGAFSGQTADDSKPDDEIKEDVIHQEEDHPSLVGVRHYISSCKELGFTKEKIKKELVKAGWDKDLVEFMLKKHF